jgi:hypothetical protein
LHIGCGNRDESSNPKTEEERKNPRAIAVGAEFLRQTSTWENQQLALLRGDGRESGNELVHAFAPAMRARCFGLFYVGDVMLLREFLVAVLAMIKVLRPDLLRRT